MTPAQLAERRRLLADRLLSGNVRTVAYSVDASVKKFDQHDLKYAPRRGTRYVPPKRDDRKPDGRTTEQFLEDLQDRQVTDYQLSCLLRDGHAMYDDDPRVDTRAKWRRASAEGVIILSSKHRGAHDEWRTPAKNHPRCPKCKKLARLNCSCPPK